MKFGLVFDAKEGFERITPLEKCNGLDVLRIVAECAPDIETLGEKFIALHATRVVEKARKQPLVASVTQQ